MYLYDIVFYYFYSMKHKINVIKCVYKCVDVNFLPLFWTRYFDNSGSKKKERNRNGKLLKLQGYKDLICNKHVNGLVFILRKNLISCLGNL